MTVHNLVKLHENIVHDRSVSLEGDISAVDGIVKLMTGVSNFLKKAATASEFFNSRRYELSSKTKKLDFVDIRLVVANKPVGLKVMLLDYVNELENSCRIVSNINQEYLIPYATLLSNIVADMNGGVRRYNPPPLAARAVVKQASALGKCFNARDRSSTTTIGALYGNMKEMHKVSDIINTSVGLLAVSPLDKTSTLVNEVASLLADIADILESEPGYLSPVNTDMLVESSMEMARLLELNGLTYAYIDAIVITLDSNNDILNAL